MQTMESWPENYDRATYVDLDLEDSERYVEFTKRCAEEMGWSYERLAGDRQLLNDMLAGNWSDDRFLIVEPGNQIVPSHDAGIMKTVTSDE